MTHSTSREQLWTLSVVCCELQRDDDVVLHAADLAAESDTLLAEAVGSLLELEGVDLHLLLDAPAHGRGVLAEQGVAGGDALVAEHVVEERHHAVLHLLGGEDAVALRSVVDAETRVREAVECPLVVFCLEAEVALDHDDNLAVDELSHLPQPRNVSFDESKLLFRLCTCIVYVRNVKQHTRQNEQKTLCLQQTFAAHQYVDAEDLRIQPTVSGRLCSGEVPVATHRKATPPCQRPASARLLRAESVTHLCRVPRANQPYSCMRASREHFADVVYQLSGSLLPTT